MFFHINEDVLRKIAEQAANAAKATAEKSGPRILRAADGSIIIDDPSLLISVSESKEPISDEEVDRVSFWNPPKGWRPIRQHPDWIEDDEEEAERGQPGP
jgi:hypothetical protein